MIKAEAVVREIGIAGLLLTSVGCQEFACVDNRAVAYNMIVCETRISRIIMQMRQRMAEALARCCCAAGMT